MISPLQRPLPDNTQHSQHTNIQALGGIRTHDRSRRVAVDLRLRPRGHWDRQSVYRRIKTARTTAKALDLFSYARMLKFHRLCFLLQWMENYFKFWGCIFCKRLSFSASERILQIVVCQSSCTKSSLYCGLALARNYTNLFAQTVFHWNKFLSVYSHTFV